MNTLKMLERLVREKAGEQEVVSYLAENATSVELARDYYKLYLRYTEEDKEITPVRISKEEFVKHFRIKGYRSDGTPEGRGSKRWKKE